MGWCCKGTHALKSVSARFNGASRLRVRIETSEYKFWLLLVFCQSFLCLMEDKSEKAEVRWGYEGGTDWFVVYAGSEWESIVYSEDCRWPDHSTEWLRVLELAAGACWQGNESPRLSPWFVEARHNSDVLCKQFIALHNMGPDAKVCLAFSLPELELQRTYPWIFISFSQKATGPFTLLARRIFIHHGHLALNSFRSILPFFLLPLRRWYQSHLRQKGWQPYLAWQPQSPYQRWSIWSQTWPYGL